MAEEAYIVAYDIQNAGNGNAKFEKTELKIASLGAKETSVGNAEWEGKGSAIGTNATKSGFLAHQGSNIVQAKLVEVKSGTAAEAVEWVRLNLAQNPGGERTVVKPNETNFQVIL